MTFEELNLAGPILSAVRAQGYTTPTPVQLQAIPLVLQGCDILAGAQTGTGKTAAFALPLLHRLSMSRSTVNRFGGLGIRALVLTPTRELAAQVEQALRVYGKNLQLSSAVIFGGVGMQAQINALRQGVDILVATPGRLLDLQQQGHLDLGTVQMLVLDEADRMLDMGFIHDVKKVLALLPAAKQSLLFSATFSDEIRALAAGLLREPRQVQVTPPNTTVELIAQTVHPVGRARKPALLAHLITQHNWSQVLVFTRTKFGANQVAAYLCEHGVKALALHGNKSQTARTEALAGFKSGELRALVATDIAARGIDIDELPHVVNYDIPNVPEDYVHRIGRTGRAGSSGAALSLVSLDEQGFMQEIERFTKQSIPTQTVEGFGPEPGEQAEPIAMGRQTLWGGLGKPPGRDVMMAAARTARTQMLQRIRNKSGNTPANKPGGRPGLRPKGPANGNNQGRRNNNTQQVQGQGQSQGQQQADWRERDDAMPRQIDPLQVNLHNRRHEARPPSRNDGSGQPDPTRTSVDGLAGAGRNRTNRFAGRGYRPGGTGNSARFTGR